MIGALPLDQERISFLVSFLFIPFGMGQREGTLSFRFPETRFFE